MLTAFIVGWMLVVSPINKKQPVNVTGPYATREECNQVGRLTNERYRCVQVGRPGQ